jgi:effector-binding domain-containing protein
MNYEIHVKQVPAQVVVTHRCHAPLAGLRDAMHCTLGRIGATVEPRGAARGAPFAVYHNEPFRPEDVDVEMGLPVAADATVEESAGVHRRELPGGPVAYTVHVGPYSTIGAAYAALYAWVEREGHRPLGPAREIYIVGPDQERNPAAYRTELEVPIAVS